MAVAQPFRTTAALGPDLTQVVKAGSWYDNGIQSPQLGVTELSSDGRKAVWVEASATITVAAAPGTQVTLTVNGDGDITAAAGAGGFYAPNSGDYDGTIVSGDRFWALEGTAP
ncbi:MAG: hypothetical protein GOVbin7759_54 [Prokaryotic dsDNA virus sp.]|jgi:hypothetical protein|nr:MAG: hypothetical protein GOVbin7759_54 [Prokaryotic dsDNA virus sp.]|tara:strand:- start:5454 stop:5792 length:339 start_codon:yes stop_codon:yes gene_type:complete